MERVRLQIQAVNLAVTVLSEMQMHIRPVAAVGPEPFPSPFQDWTCKIEIAQTDATPEAASSLQPVEVIIKHTRENVTQRLTQLFSTSDVSSTDTNTPAETLLTRAQ